MTSLSDSDREFLRLQWPEWRLARASFTPNVFTRDLEARGLIEVRADHERTSPTFGRFHIRRTELADQLLAGRGAA